MDNVVTSANEGVNLLATARRFDRDTKAVEAYSRRLRRMLVYTVKRVVPYSNGRNTVTL